MITGPSGIGKTYLTEQLVNQYPSHFEPLRLYTTRPARDNEYFTDRIHVTKSEFTMRFQNGDFFVADQFHGNWYGYSKRALRNNHKIVVGNTWPALIPKFIHIPGLYLIGMTLNNNGVEILKKRMIDRGDSHKTVHERTKLISKDVQDLESVRPLIEKFGKIFKILDNSTIHEDVIPWIKSSLLNDA